MNEVLREFLLETHENLAQLDLDLVTLEKEPTERDTLARVFRTLHTVKGTAGFLGFPRLQNVAHAGEHLLSRLRDGHLRFNAEIASALLGVVDAVRRVLASIEQTEQEGDGDFTALIRTLERLRGGESVVVRTPSLPAPNVTAIAPARPAPIPTTPEPVEHAEPRAAPVADSAVRVDVGLLDSLMNLVGELVLARNQIVQFSAAQADAAFLGTVQRFNLLTTELQANVMKTRMQPIGNIWSKLPRVVRDLAVACGKQVHLELDGQETELDRTIVEAIRDPLTHLVRNGVDHGIEPPAERLRRGKPAAGRLALHAAHEGGNVTIEIADDGSGIDPQRIRARAIQTNVAAADQAERLSERELLNLLFLPGFSTAEKVTQFSGRGVGMDVVRTNVEKIGGTVDIESRLGRGTTVRLKIPLTLAIIPALTVTSGGDRYAIPQVSLLELVRLDGDQALAGIELIHGAAVHRLRGNLLPLVYLNRALQVDTASQAASDAGRPETNIIVVQADDRPFGLVVDMIHDTEEIVVKPLQKQLRGIGVFAGATIMGDGKVALILDVHGLAQRPASSRAFRSATRMRMRRRRRTPTARRFCCVQAKTAGGWRSRCTSWPGWKNSRAPPWNASAARKSCNTATRSCRFSISRMLRRGRRSAGNGQAKRRTERLSATETLQVVVCSANGQRAGLVVGQILDIVEETPATRRRAQRPGVLFTAVLQGRVTEFLDVDAIIRSADPEFVVSPEVPDGRQTLTQHVAPEAPDARQIIAQHVSAGLKDT